MNEEEFWQSNPRAPLTRETIQRFWSQVRKIRTARGDGCWLWTGKCNTQGAALMRVEREDGMKMVVGVHRIAWEIAEGSAPPYGKLVCHNCPRGDQRHCVRRTHLWLGTQGENIQDAIQKGQIGKRKLALKDYPAAAARLEAGERARAVADDYGVSVATIYKSRRGKEKRGGNFGHQWIVICSKCGIRKPDVDLRSAGMMHKCLGGNHVART